MGSTNVSATKAEIDEEKVELSKFDKFKKFVTPDRHRKIENMGRRVTTLGVTGVILLGATGYFSYENSIDKLSDQAMYTSQFQTSKTGQSGTIQGVYSNKDRSRVLVMMKFDDAAQMSGIASNYRTFLAGSSSKGEPESIKDHPSGSIIMFGQGYMGLYLTKSGGFSKQIMSAIMRADKQLVSSNDVGSQTDADPRKSFQTYDQWEVFFNPGGKNSTHIAALDSPKLDIGRIYYDTVLKTAEQAQHKALNDDLVTMNAKLSTIQDYRTRLLTTSINGLKVKVPEDPQMVKGDQITGHADEPGSPSTLMLKTNTVFNNGFNFDWRKTSIEKGILKDLVPKGENYITWFNKKMSAQAQSDPSATTEWKLSDGTDLSSVTTSDVTTFQNVNAMVQSLTTAWSEYYTAKEKYQSDDLGQLLSLEMQLKDVVQNNNINASDRAINFYV